MLNEPARRFSWNAYSEKTQFRFIREVKASLRFLWSSMDFRKILFSNDFGFSTLTRDVALLGWSFTNRSCTRALSTFS